MSRSFLGVLAMLAISLQTAPAGGEVGRDHYEVKPGDTLWSIAEITIGDPSLWPALYRANRDQIKNPTHVYPGQMLTIPSVDPSTIRAVRREARELLGRSGTDWRAGR